MNGRSKCKTNDQTFLEENTGEVSLWPELDKDFLDVSPKQDPSKDNSDFIKIKYFCSFIDTVNEKTGHGLGENICKRL